MERIVGISAAADVLGVSISTLRRWERLAASSAVSACGEERSGAARKSRLKRASKKQEPNGIGELCAA
ncbi:MAG TPA: hypothetical protein VLJ17_08700 [Xanthobacteraceae bacterium]|nr:hypothetical protein [Xanthobacteraceae bacterium]